MERLMRVFLEGEDELVRLARECATARGYATRMPALERDHRAAIAAFTAHMAEMVTLEGDIRHATADVTPEADQAASLGAHFSRYVSSNGDPSVRLGMVKCYRFAYLKLIGDSDGIDASDRLVQAFAIARFFDRVEIGLVANMFEPSSSADAYAVANHDRYLKAFSRLPLPAILIDPDGRLAHMNEAADRLYAPLATVGGTRLQADRALPRAFARRIDQFLDSDQDETSFEQEMKTTKGPRHFQVNLTRTNATAQGLSGVLAVLNDLTYRRHAEQALRRSQARYVSLFENMPLAFVHSKAVLDRHNRPEDHLILEVNPAFEELVGSPSADLVGRSLGTVLARLGTAGDWLKLLARTAVTGEPGTLETRLGADGRWLSLSAFGPSPGHSALMISDVTDLKAVHESLKRARDSYMTMFEGVPALVWRSNRAGDVDFVNEAWLDFTGCTMIEATGDGWCDAVHPDDRDCRRAALRAAAETMQGLEIEYRLRRSDGAYRWLRETARPFEDPAGGLGGLLGTAVDVTEQRRRDSTLEAMATHDLFTGLPNRRLFEEALKRASAAASRGERSMLLMIDLECCSDQACRLEEGDEFLSMAADAMTQSVRSGDLVASLGTTRFAALLTSAGEPEARNAAERLVVAIAELAVMLPGRSPKVYVGGAGIEENIDPMVAMRRAESALHQARAAGGGCRMYQEMTYTAG